MTQTYSGHFDSDGNPTNGRPRQPNRPVCADAVEYEIAATGDIDELADRVALLALPPGARILECYLEWDDLDTGATGVAKLVASNGTVADDVDLMTALDIQSAGNSRDILPGDSPALDGTTDHIRVEMVITTAPGTPATGTLKCYVLWDA